MDLPIDVIDISVTSKDGANERVGAAAQGFIHLE